MCLTPINLQKTTFKQKLNDTYFLQQVPCGKCLECRKLRVNSWFVRLLNEKTFQPLLTLLRLLLKMIIYLILITVCVLWIMGFINGLLSG